MFQFDQRLNEAAFDQSTGATSCEAVLHPVSCRTSSQWKHSSEMEVSDAQSVFEFMCWLAGRALVSSHSTWEEAAGGGDYSSETPK